MDLSGRAPQKGGNVPFQARSWDTGQSHVRSDSAPQLEPDNGIMAGDEEQDPGQCAARHAPGAESGPTALRSAGSGPHSSYRETAMNESKPLRVEDLNEEQRECLLDHDRRARARDAQ